MEIEIVKIVKRYQDFGIDLFVKGRKINRSMIYSDCSLISL